MAKILVSGGAGFIGSHVVEMFISHVYEVVVSDGTAKVGKTRHIDPIAAKANREPGCSPTIHLEHGLGETVEYFKATELVS